MPDTRAAPILAENLMYIEQVKYTEPYGLQLTGGDDQRMQTFLAQMGLKSEEDLVESMRTIFYPKDRDIVLNEGQTIKTSSTSGGQTSTVYFAEVPINGIIGWNGTTANIPSNWALCNGSNGTPDLRDRFIIGAGGNFATGTTGGTLFDPLVGLLANLVHSHTAGTLAADSSGAHTHGSGTLSTDSDNHSHGPGTLDTDNDSHTHGPGTLDTDNDSHTHTLPTTDVDTTGTSFRTPDTPPDPIFTVATFTHTHTISSNSGSDQHDHAVNAGVTASDSHDHAVNAGTTASDSHSHSVTGGTTASDGAHVHTISGATDTALDTLVDITPPWFALLYIMRIS